MKKVLFFVVMLALLVSTATSQTVVQKIKIGNSVEAITYIPTGAYAKHIAMLDGMDLNLIPNEGHGPTPVKKAFSFDSLGLTTAPRGLAWIGFEKLWIFSSPTVGGTSTTFTLGDLNGKPKGTIVFNWPADFIDNAPYVEGVAWIPLNAPKYAGMLAFIGQATAGDGWSRIFIMNRNGEMVNQIVLDDIHYPFYYIYPTGLAYRAPGQLLVGNTDGNLFQMDLDGTILADPIYFEDAIDIEGIAVLKDNDVAISSHSTGKMIYLDKALSRTGEIRNYRTSFGLSSPFSVAWNSNTNEYLIYCNDYEPTVPFPQIAAVAGDLKSSRLYFDMVPYNANYGRMEYQPFMNAVVMPFRGAPRHFEYFSPDFGEWFGPMIGNGAGQVNQLTALALVPPTWEYGTRRTPTPTRLEVIDFMGQPTGRIFDLAPWMVPGTSIIDVTFLSSDDTWPGDFMVLTNSNPRLAIRVTYDGTVVAVHTVPLSIGNLKAITSGPLAGKFFGTDGNSNELIIFSLP